VRRSAASTKRLQSQRRRHPRQSRARQTVEVILDAVAEVLKRDGISAVTTNRIAEVAGISIGSVYQYFPDKRAIFVALHQRHIERIDRLIQAKLLENADAPLETMFRAMIDAMIDAHTPDPALYALMYSEVPHRTEGTKDFGVRMHNAFRLAIAARAHELKGARNPDRMAFVVTHMVDALSHGAVLRRPPGLSLSDATEEIVHVVLAYLRS
jgi:AcrR family transcriptional regulator